MGIVLVTSPPAEKTTLSSRLVTSSQVASSGEVPSYWIKTCFVVVGLEGIVRWFNIAFGARIGLLSWKEDGSEVRTVSEIGPLCGFNKEM